MTHGVPRLPKLTLSRPFVQDFLAQEAPCFALSLVEERGQLFAVLALRPGVSLPPDITDRGFNLGYSLLGTAHFEVIHFAFEFPGFETYNVLLNPNHPVVQTVVGRMVEQGGYFILAIGPDQGVTAFRTDFGQPDRIGLKDTLPLMQRCTTTAAQYEQALAHFRRRPDPIGPILEWVCRTQRASLDPTQDPLELSPAPARRTTVPTTVAQRVLAKELDARVKALERAGAHDMELFVQMAGQMPLFRRLLDMAGPDGMSALCDEYAGLYRYAKLLERIASGIHTGAIKVPR